MTVVITSPLSEIDAAELTWYGAEAEFALLTCMVRDNARVPEVARVLTAAEFAFHANGAIFEAIKALVKEGEIADTVTIHARLASVLQSLGGIRYLDFLTARDIDVEHILGYAASVRDHAKRREVIKLCTEMVGQAATADGHAISSSVANFAQRLTAVAPPTVRPWEKALLDWSAPELSEAPTKVDFAVDGLIQAGKVGLLSLRRAVPARHR